MLEAREIGREADVINFITSAIADHKSSYLYQTAVDAKLYYQGENPTISRYEKIVYDMQGKAHRDMWTANHKIKSKFFKIVVDQEVNYLLGNGITLKKGKDKLGKNFDQIVSRAAKYAVIGGVSFGFWNLDHIEVFRVTEFVPLYDEENGALMAGIRFWQVADNKPLRCTLYEIDGYTEYIRRSGEDMVVLHEKQSYVIHATAAAADKDKIYTGENYPTFPIVPLKYDDDSRPEICGGRNTIDALDLMRSGMVNNTDEGSIIYWALTNCGGMDYVDAEKFLQTVKTTHVAFMDNADDGAHAEPHTVEMPVTSSQATIDMLTRTLFEDFQAINTGDETLNASTATGIKFRYVSLDLKVDGLEGQVTEFLHGIFALAGVDDEPTYTRNRIINTLEEMQTVIMAADYLDDEYITTKALTLMGDADQVEAVKKRRSAEELSTVNAAGATETPDEDDAIDAAEEAVGRTLNGSQTNSLLSVLRGVRTGEISENQAVLILKTSIGLSREDALAIIRGEE